MSIAFDPTIQTACPELHLGTIRCAVVVEPGSSELWALLDQTVAQRRAELVDTTAIAPLPAIRSTRRGNKSCGKDHARCRASAESLLRRVGQGKGLYRVNNVVDIINGVSLKSAFSIGGYDAEQIEGPIRLGIGTAEETYLGIGRGRLNIAQLPVLRDQRGAFGSPTSDSQRTRIQAHTRHLLLVFFAFGATETLASATERARDYLKRFASATAIESQIIKVHAG